MQDFSAAEDLTQDVFVKLTRHIHSYADGIVLGVPVPDRAQYGGRTIIERQNTQKTIPETLQADRPCCLRQRPGWT